MSNYIPRAGPFKKLDFLKKCEQDLVREIRSPLSDYTTKRLFRAAERVRAAHLAVLKAKKSYLSPQDKNFSSSIKNFDLEASDWTSKKIEDIITKYEANS